MLGALLISSNTLVASAQSVDEREDRGFVETFLPFLREEDGRDDENENKGGAAATQTSPPEQPAPSASPTQPSPQVGSQVPAMPLSDSVAEAAATTDPSMLNTHSGSASSIYAQTGLSRGESGLLFVFSIGLALAGLLLAEQPFKRGLGTVGSALSSAVPLTRPERALP